MAYRDSDEEPVSLICPVWRYGCHHQEWCDKHGHCHDADLAFREDPFAVADAEEKNIQEAQGFKTTLGEVLLKLQRK